MMASPCGVVGPSEVVTPPRSRLSPTPGVGRGGDLLPEPRSSPSPGVGRGGDRLPELRLSPSPGVRRGGDRRPRRGRVRALGSGEAEIVVRGEVESEPLGRARRRSWSEARSSPSPGVGRGGDRRPRRGRVRALGSGEAEIVVRDEVESEPWVGRGGDSYGARGWTWLMSTSPWRVAQQSEQRRRRCFPVRSVSGGAK
jgi:hypothetical protein